MAYSAFVGLATMLAVFPVPGYITRQIQWTQREKMRRVRPGCPLLVALLTLFL